MYIFLCGLSTRVYRSSNSFNVNSKALCHFKNFVFYFLSFCLIFLPFYNFPCAVVLLRVRARKIWTVEASVGLSYKILTAAVVSSRSTIVKHFDLFDIIRTHSTSLTNFRDGIFFRHYRFQIWFSTPTYWWIMHYRVVIVDHVVCCSFVSIEIQPKISSFHDVIVNDINVIIPVGSTLFMLKTDSMQKFVNYYSF